MKRYLLIIILFFVTSLINAQSYQLINKGEDLSGKEVTIKSDDLEPYTDAKIPSFMLEIKNASSSNIAKTRVSYAESTIAEGVTVQACESFCFAYETFSLQEIAAGASRTIKFQFTFDGEFKTSVLKINVFDDAKPTEIQTITVKITAGPTSILTEKIDKNLNIFPNPATDNFTISHNYGQDAQIAIFDMLGKKIDCPVYNNGSSIRVNCSSWDNGYYFCRLFKDGKIEKTVKIIVSN